MFDVLMYLFETYIHTDVDAMVEQDALADELTQAGFHKEEILKALAWLERLAELQEAEEAPTWARSAPDSFRIYTQEELYKIDAEGRGFLLFLEQIKVLNAETREIVIDRLMELDPPEIELDDLKWVVMMVLFNVPGSESAYQQLEELIFEQPEGAVH
jgi:Smg protein